MRAVHNVEMEKRKRGRPRKLYEHIELDEYMSTVAEKENAFDHGDENEHAIINQVEDAPGCGATKQRQHDEWDGVKRDLRTVPCKICGKVLAKNGHLDRHMKAVHKVEVEKRKRGKPKGVEQEGDSEAKTSRNDRQKVVCDLCGKSVSSKGLAAHKDMHMQVVCDLCGKSVSLNRLKAHKDMHMLERTIKCEFQGCSKYFRTNKELKR